MKEQGAAKAGGIDDDVKVPVAEEGQGTDGDGDRALEAAAARVQSGSWPTVQRLLTDSMMLPWARSSISRRLNVRTAS